VTYDDGQRAVLDASMLLTPASLDVTARLGIDDQVVFEGSWAFPPERAGQEGQS
jgi:hypothetical protein